MFTELLFINGELFERTYLPSDMGLVSYITISHAVWRIIAIKEIEEN